MMKKLVCLVLSLALVLSLFAGCKDTEKQPSGEQNTPPAGSDSGEVVLEKHKIAVANWAIDSYALLIQEYFSKYLGPALNVEFMFSEACNSVEATMDFFESAYAAGCEAVINYQQGSVDQLIAKANELGLYIVTNTSAVGENNAPPYNVGFVHTYPSETAEEFSTLIRGVMEGDEQQNIIILSAGAGLGHAEYYACTVAALETIQEVYGVTFEDSIEELAVLTSVTDCANDGDVKVTIYPGYPNNDNYALGLSSLLQTGEYGILVSCSTAYARVANTIDEVEKAFNMNIKVTAMTQVNEETSAMFNAVDSAGDPALNSASVRPAICTAASMFALAYNGISGHADSVRKDGEGIFYNCPRWLCNGPEDYAPIEKLDVSDDTWELSVDDVKEMLAIYNPDLTADSLFDTINSFTLDNVLERRGMK